MPLPSSEYQLQQLAGLLAEYNISVPPRLQEDGTAGSATRSQSNFPSVGAVASTSLTGLRTFSGGEAFRPQPGSNLQGLFSSGHCRTLDLGTPDQVNFYGGHPTLLQPQETPVVGRVGRGGSCARQQVGPRVQHAEAALFAEAYPFHSATTQSYESSQVLQSIPSGLLGAFAQPGTFPQSFEAPTSLDHVTLGQLQLDQQQQQQALHLQQLQAQELLQLQLKGQELQLQQQQQLLAQQHQQQQQLWELSAASQRLGASPVLQVATPMLHGVNPPTAARSSLDIVLASPNQNLDVLGAAGLQQLTSTYSFGPLTQLPSPAAAGAAARVQKPLTAAVGAGARRPSYAPPSSLYLQHKRNHAAAALGTAADEAGAFPPSGAAAVAAAMQGTSAAAAARTSSSATGLQLGPEALDELQVLLARSNLLVPDGQRRLQSQVNFPRTGSTSSSVSAAALLQQLQQQQLQADLQDQYDEEPHEGEEDDAGDGGQADGKGAAWKNKKMNLKLYKVRGMHLPMAVEGNCAAWHGIEEVTSMQGHGYSQ